MEEAMAVYPEAHVFDHDTVPKKVTDIGTVNPYLFARAEYPESGGILVYKQGLLYPTKGFVFPQAVQCINVAKRGLLDAVFLASYRAWWPTYLWLAVSSFTKKRKFVNRLIAVYNRAMVQIIKPIAPQRFRQIDIASELQGMIEVFLTDLGIDTAATPLTDEKVLIPGRDGKRLGNAETFAEIVATIINYDNAYHLRLVDIFSEMNQAALLAHPIRELERVLAIYQQRELALQVPQKFRAMLRLLKIVFLSRRVRQAFHTAVKQANWPRLQYDPIWRYNVLERGDYNFMGLTYPERYEIFLVLHNFKPPPHFTVL